MLVFILFLCAVTSTVHVNAMPVPEPQHNPGDVVAVKSTAWGENSSLRHQAVVLTGADENNQHLVAPVSSNLPPPLYPHTGDANAVHPGFTPGYLISLSTPRSADGSQMLPSQRVPTPVAADKLATLKTDINAACGSNLTRRDGSCAMRKKPNSANHAVHAPARSRNPKAIGHTAGAKSRSPSAKARTAGARGRVSGARGRTAPTRGRTPPARKAPARGRKAPSQRARQAVQKKPTSRRK